MLPATARLRRRAQFSAAVRRGRLGRSPLVQVHLECPPSSVPASGPVLAGEQHPSGPAPSLVGFVVSRAVGSAVVRNRVRRRLRHAAAARVAGLPAGSRLVVRALPRSARATSAELAGALDRAVDQALHRGADPTRAARPRVLAGRTEPSQP